MARRIKFHIGVAKRRHGGEIRVLLTGTAGVIGYHVAERFLARGDTCLGVDNLNSLGTGGSSGDRADQ